MFRSTVNGYDPSYVNLSAFPMSPHSIGFLEALLGISLCIIPLPFTLQCLMNQIYTTHFRMSSPTPTQFLLLMRRYYQKHWTKAANREKFFWKPKNEIIVHIMHYLGFVVVIRTLRFENVFDALRMSWKFIISHLDARLFARR